MPTRKTKSEEFFFDEDYPYSGMMLYSFAIFSFDYFFFFFSRLILYEARGFDNNTQQIGD